MSSIGRFFVRRDYKDNVTGDIQDTTMGGTELDVRIRVGVRQGVSMGEGTFTEVAQGPRVARGATSKEY